MLDGGADDDILNGGDGEDIAIYSGNCTDYEIRINDDGTYTISSDVEGVDTLIDIEKAQFNDVTLSLADIEFDEHGVYNCEARARYRVMY